MWAARAAWAPRAARAAWKEVKVDREAAAWEALGRRVAAAKVASEEDERAADSDPEEMTAGSGRRAEGVVALGERAVVMGTVVVGVARTARRRKRRRRPA